MTFLLAAVQAFLLFACTRNSPVTPPDVPPMDERVERLARYAVTTAKMLVPAGRAAWYTLDSLSDPAPLPENLFTREYLNRANVRDFVECYERFYMGEDISCNYYDYGAYGVLYPRQWLPDAVDSGTFFSRDLIRLRENRHDSTRTVAYNEPKIMQWVDSLTRTDFGYFGNFESDTPAADRFNVKTFSYTLHPLGMPYDSIEIIIHEFADNAFLTQNTAPESSMVQVHYYIKDDSAGHFSGYSMKPGDRPLQFDEYWHFRRDDNASDLFQLERVLKTENDFIHFAVNDSLLRVRRSADTLVRGRWLSDSVFADTLAGWIVLSQPVNNGPWGHWTVLNRPSVSPAVSDTLITGRFDADAVELTAVYKKGNGAPEDTLRASVASEPVMVFDTLDGVATGVSVCYRADLVVLELTGTVLDDADVRFTGVLQINPYTLQGQGYILDGQHHISYTLTADLAGTSKVHDRVIGD